MKQIIAGSPIVLSLTDANALCLGWLYSPCDRVLVSVPATGTLTVTADPKDETAGRPQIQVCCVNGDERIGNPVTIPVEAGRVEVEVGQPPPPGRKTESVTVRTSFEPS